MGSGRIADAEVGAQVAFNVAGDGLARAGQVDALRAMLGEARAAILVDPAAGFRAMMASAPPEDQTVLADPAWIPAFGRGLSEALAPGVDGWLDEALVINGDWPDIDLGAVTCSVTWWHSAADRNCPFSAAHRLVARLPNARLVAWEVAGHLAAYRREPEILDELLARAEAAVGVE